MERRVVALCSGCGSLDIHDSDEEYSFICNDCGIIDYWENASFEDADAYEDGEED